MFFLQEMVSTVSSLLLLAIGLNDAPLVKLTPALTNELAIVVHADRPDATYRKNEEIKFFVELKRKEESFGGVRLHYRRSGDDGKVEEGEFIAEKDNLFLYRTKLDRPGFVRLEVFALDENGKPLKGREPIRFDTGAGVEPLEIRAYPEPADFAAYWKRQCEKLSRVPIVELERKPVPSEKKGMQSYDVKVQCAGPRPVSGYLVMPENARFRSLPAVIRFQGYGVFGVESPASGTRNTILFDVNAHGIENGFPSGYYLEKYKNLQNYGFSNEENQNPDSCYFYYMLLRAVRAVDYITTLPQWDGKHILVYGHSQGGFQAVAAAALHPGVSACEAVVPGMADLGGRKYGRLSGFVPDYQPGIAYFDGCGFAKLLRCPVILHGGLGDYIAPPSALMALYNNIRTQKSVDIKQGRTHRYDPENMPAMVFSAPAAPGMPASASLPLPPGMPMTPVTPLVPIGLPAERTENPPTAP